MKVTPTAIPEVLVIEPKVYDDARGFFLETYQEQKYARAGINLPMVQDNHSGSTRGVLRGLHYQRRRPQGKLIHVIAGEVFDVAVDVRRSSPRCGQWVGVSLSARGRKQMWVPPGFAHGFYVVSDWAEVIYKVTGPYDPEDEHTLRWDDPSVGVCWPIPADASPVLSAKDARGKLLAELPLFD